jgi:hypothetical protein
MNEVFAKVIRDPDSCCPKSMCRTNLSNYTCLGISFIVYMNNAWQQCAHDSNEITFRGYEVVLIPKTI